MMSRWAFYLTICCFYELITIGSKVANPRFRYHRNPDVAGFLNEKVRLNCNAKGSPRPYIHWFRSEPGSRNCSNIRIDEDKLRPRVTFNRYTLFFRQLKAEDEGMWCCKVWNRNGEILRNFNLTIIDKDRWNFFVQYKRHCLQDDSNIDFEFLRCICPDLRRFYKPNCNSIDVDIRFAINTANMTMEDEDFLRKWVHGYRQEEERLAVSDGMSSGNNDFESGHGHQNKMVGDQPKGVQIEDHLNDNGINSDIITDIVPGGIRKPSLERPFATGGLKNNPHTSKIFPQTYEDLLDTNVLFNHDRAPYFARKPFAMPQLVAKPAGSGVKLPCRAYGEPIPTVTWYKNGIKLNDGDPRGISNRYIIRQWNIMMPEAVTSDNGVYMCDVRNKLGKITYNYTVKIVERHSARPYMHPDYPKNVTVATGSNASFECPVVSDLHYHIEWMYLPPEYEKMNISLVYILNDDEKFFIAPPEELLVTNVTEEDEGWYTCLVGNSIGYDFRSAYLAVVPGDIMMDIGALVEKNDGRKAIIYVTVFFFFLATAIIGCFLLLKHKDRKKLQATILASHAQPNAGFTPGKKKINIMRQDSLSGSLAPLITITPSTTSGRTRLSSDLTQISEYDMPLDEKWEIARDQIVLKRILGEGAFGQVWRVDYTKPGSPSMTVAVKMLKCNATEREMVDLVSEMELMKSFFKLEGRHSNIISLIGCCTQDGPLYVIVELCENGNLRDYLRAHRLPDSASEQAIVTDSGGSSGYEEPNEVRKLRLTQTKSTLMQRDLVSFAFQIARGMACLESRSFIHRDLAARNILVARDQTLKIADFGLARDLHYVDYYKKKTDGRLPVKWMAPEALFDRLYTSKSDVWSYGVIMWEIWTMGGTPYPGIPVEKLFHFLKEGHRNDRPLGCMDAIWNLMQACWDYDPHRRPMFKSIEQALDTILTESVSYEYTETLDGDSSASYKQSVDEAYGDKLNGKRSSISEPGRYGVNEPPTYGNIRKFTVGATDQPSLDMIFPVSLNGQALLLPLTSDSDASEVNSDPSTECGNPMPHSPLKRTGDHLTSTDSSPLEPASEDGFNCHHSSGPIHRLEKSNSDPDPHQLRLLSDDADSGLAADSEQLSPCAQSPSSTVSHSSKKKLKGQPQLRPSSEVFSVDLEESDCRSTSTQDYSSESVGMKSSLSSRPSSTPSEDDEGCTTSASSRLAESDESTNPLLESPDDRPSSWCDSSSKYPPINRHRIPLAKKIINSNLADVKEHYYANFGQQRRKGPRSHYSNTAVPDEKLLGEYADIAPPSELPPLSECAQSDGSDCIGGRSKPPSSLPVGWRPESAPNAKRWLNRDILGSDCSERFTNSSSPESRSDSNNGTDNTNGEIIYSQIMMSSRESVV